VTFAGSSDSGDAVPTGDAPAGDDQRDALTGGAPDLPESIRERYVGFVEQASGFSGPLPPALLREYNEVLPGLADRIVRMTETQASHRMSLEQSVIRSEQRRSWAGWASGTAIAVGLVVAAVWVTLEGHDTVGGVFAAADVAGIAAVLVLGRRGGTVDDHTD
jgi:uncharacterized membrane protein